MFTLELNNVRDQAKAYIQSILDKRGDGYELTDPTDWEDGDDGIPPVIDEDMRFSCPSVMQIGERYGNTTIDMGYVLAIHSDLTCEVYIPEGSDTIIPLSNMSTDEIVAIADHIAELENDI